MTRLWQRLEFSAKLAAEEFAPGIPKSRTVDPLPEIKSPQSWTLVTQRHVAAKAGEHLDLRLVDTASGKAHSWALPAARLPAPGKSVLAVPQPTHTADYALNFGKDKVETIEKGYGKGTVKIERLEPVDVYHSKAKEEPGTRVRFNLYPSTGPEEYAIIRAVSGKDYLVNKTLTRERVPHLDIGSKPKLKEIKFKDVDTSHEDEVLMPKLDGAHTLLDLPREGKIPRLFSYREPIRHSAGVIEHTHKVPLLLKLRVPDGMERTTLRTETIALDNLGKPLPAKDIAGMLNATVSNSRARQKELDARLHPVAFDIIRHKGKDVSQLPFPTRYKLLKEITMAVGVPIIEVATTKFEKDRLVQQVSQGLHPLTNEGIIIQKTEQPTPAIKAKLRPTHDVYIRDVFGATSGNGTKLDRAGGFTYSWEPDGKIVGRVGTGFDHATLRDMLQNPEKYKGRVAEVAAEQKYSSGALGKPSFVRLHLEKGKQD